MPEQRFNRYGDELRPTTGVHGADISSQRMDALDAAAVAHAFSVFKAQKPGHAIDLGGGSGVQALRFAALGVPTLLIDQLPAQQVCWHGSQLERFLPLQHVSLDVRDLRPHHLPPAISLLYSQRFLHYLRFDEAVALLNLLGERLTPQARCFLSVSGMGSELSRGYPHRDRHLPERFAPLASAVAAHHGIAQPVCLYEPEDLVALTSAVQLQVVKLEVSPFGNVKGEFVRER